MSKVKYQVFEINSFSILTTKLEDLEKENYLVEITPISNSGGEITKYFIFAKKSAPIKKREVKEFEVNKPAKVFKFNG